MVDLSIEELQIERSAADYLQWVENRIEEISATEDGKHAIRSGVGLAKQLVEEALPLGIFALHHFHRSEEVGIRLTIGDQNYDATIKDNRKEPSPFVYVEVTQAHEGEAQHLRMLALQSNGHVNVLGAIHKTGTKVAGIHVEVENEAIRHDVVLTRELERIEAAIQRKIGKQYPDGTALLVVFDDYISMRNEHDIQAIHNALTKLLPLLNQFTWLAVVGWSKKVFVEFDLRAVR